MEATEPVDDFRSPANDIDSRFLRGIVPLVVDDVGAETCLGTRDEVDGDARTE